jgi:hypothetical protein
MYLAPVYRNGKLVLPVYAKKKANEAKAKS